jgi:exodeoxyribonuclease-3
VTAEAIKVATWNVNSVRARLPHVLLWLQEVKPDVLLLQETKSMDDKFPYVDIEAAGYEVAHYGQPAYNGVAIISRLPLTEIIQGMPTRADDPQARVLAATIKPADKPVRLVCAYVPNGQSVGSDKYLYKLEWLADFCDYLSDARARYTRVVAGGDYNIAPEASDIYDAEAWGEEVLASPPERAALKRILDVGYADAHRLFEQPEKSFSWWDYRAAAFRRNIGVRIDLLLLSADLSKKCVFCAPDITPRSWERPSDHAPVVANLLLN